MVKFGKEIAKFKATHNLKDREMLNYKAIKKELNKVGKQESFDDTQFQNTLEESIDDVYDVYNVRIEEVYAAFNSIKK